MTTKERPIMFTGEMVRAILAGKKTVTRRLVKPMPGKQRQWLTAEGIDSVPHGHMSGGGWQMHHPKADQVIEWAPGKTLRVEHDSPLGWIRSPYGTAGDRLWVRETWCAADNFYQCHELEEPRTVAYAADRSARCFGDPTDPKPVPSWDIAQWNWDTVTWKPSIHMPRWASRITLEVVDVRVERLQDITEEDAAREGVDDGPGRGPRLYPSGQAARGAMGHKWVFQELWDTINGKRAPWASNCWVWRVEFRRVQP